MLERLREAMHASRQAVHRSAKQGRIAVPAISHWSTLEHVHHLALVDGTALDQVAALLRGEDGPRRHHGRRTFLGAVLLALGWIPRGRARAPEGLRPPHEPRVDAILSLLSALEERVGELDGRAAEIGGCRRRRNHFVFGDLTAAEWLRFAAIHGWHHLKIVRDIEAASGKGSPGRA